MIVAVQSTLVQQHPGQATLLEQNDTFTVLDGDGKTVFEGDEVSAEFKYWGTVFGVDDVEVEA